jgi:hypothetical protein
VTNPGSASSAATDVRLSALALHQAPAGAAHLVYESRRSLARTTMAALSAKGRFPGMTRSRRAAGRELPVVASRAVAVGTSSGEE